MIKKIFTLFIFFFLTVETFAAGTSSSDKKPSYKNAVKIIEAAKKYESKNKMDKALKRYEKAQKILLKGCNCEEYQELKEIIDGSKKSKY